MTFPARQPGSPALQRLVHHCHKDSDQKERVGEGRGVKWGLLWGSGLISGMLNPSSIGHAACQSLWAADAQYFGDFWQCLKGFCRLSDPHPQCWGCFGTCTGIFGLLLAKPKPPSCSVKVKCSFFLLLYLNFPGPIRCQESVCCGAPTLSEWNYGILSHIVPISDTEKMVRNTKIKKNPNPFISSLVT